MAFRPNEAARNLILDDGMNGFDGAAITYYSGTQPGAGGGSHSETLLATGALGTPAFAAASGGAVSPASTWSGSISETGTAAWARITQGSAIIDMDVGTSGASLNLDDVAFEDGGSVNVTGGTITLPGNDA